MAKPFCTISGSLCTVTNTIRAAGFLRRISSRSRHAVEARHGNVGDDDIGSECFGCGNERIAIADSSDHFELPLHHRPEVFNNLRMIIGQKNSRAYFFFPRLNMLMSMRHCR